MWFGFLVGPIIICSFITIIISFIFFPIAKFFSIIVKVLLSSIIILSNFFSGIPFSKIYITTPSIFKILLYYIIIIIGKVLVEIYFLRWKKFNNNTYLRARNLIALAKYRVRQNKERLKIIVTLLLIISLLFNIIFVEFKGLKIYFVDVGQR